MCAPCGQTNFHCDETGRRLITVVNSCLRLNFVVVEIMNEITVDQYVLRSIFSKESTNDLWLLWEFHRQTHIMTRHQRRIVVMEIGLLIFFDHCFLFLQPNSRNISLTICTFSETGKSQNKDEKTLHFLFAFVWPKREEWNESIWAWKRLRSSLLFCFAFFCLGNWNITEKFACQRIPFFSISVNLIWPTALYSSTLSNNKKSLSFRHFVQLHFRSYDSVQFGGAFICS